jgi:hypothetical protein
MNKEQIILDVYREHCLEQSKYLRHGGTIQEFINKIKTDSEFSEKWGLKIEERELSLDEELEYMMGKVFSEEALTHQVKIPTKLITITYNDKTIESYEQRTIS